MSHNNCGSFCDKGLRSDEMKKTLKLKKNYEFRKILTRGQYFSGQYLDFYILSHNKKINYIGIAIGSKITNAVKRNKIKRLIRENYRQIEENLRVGYSIVFLWKKKIDVKEATYLHIKEDINRVFQKAGILE